MSPVRLGVLGCADIAWRRVLPAVAATDGTVVAVVASRDPGRAARFAARFGADPAPCYDAVLERADVDAVYLPLPPALRGGWVRRALAAGKHVLAEKPLTHQATETAQLVAEARERGLVLLENLAFLRHRSHRTVRAKLHAGVVGEIRHVAATFTIPPRADGDIRLRPDLGGGALLDCGVYPLWAAATLLDAPLRVAGAVLREDRRYGVDVAGSAVAVSGSGATASLTFGMDGAYRAAYEVYGSTGRLVVERAFSPPASYQPVLRLERQDQVCEQVLAADDQVAQLIGEFRRLVAEPERAGRWGEASVQQARLVEQVAQRAVRVRSGPGRTGG